MEQKTKTKVPTRTSVLITVALLGALGIAAIGVGGINNLTQNQTSQPQTDSSQAYIDDGGGSLQKNVESYGGESVNCSLINLTDYDDGSYLSTTQDAGEEMVKTALSLNKHQEWVSLPSEDIASTLEDEGPWELIDSVIEAGGTSALQGYVVVDECEENIVVSFRGSESSDCAKPSPTNSEISTCVTEMISNVLTDAYAKKRAMDWLSSDIDDTETHAGFNKDYERVRDDILERIEEYPDYSVFVTGFSLGAGVATIAALDISDTLGRDTYLYTGGSPRLGNEDFVSVLEHHVFAVRIVANKDPVAMISSYQTIGSNTSDELGQLYNALIDELFESYLLDYVLEEYGIDIKSKIPSWLTSIVEKLYETLSEPFLDRLLESVADYDHAGLLLQLGPKGSVVDEPTVKLINSDRSRHTYENYRDILLEHLEICQTDGCDTDMESAANNEREKNRALFE